MRRVQRRMTARPASASSEQHLRHFPDLLAIATPGPFFFMGDVPDEMKQATEQMQLDAE